jgi:hypothetical protein
MFKSRIYHYCLILSTITLGINTTSVSAQNTKKSQEIIKAKNFINSVNSIEQLFYIDAGEFTDDVKRLELNPSNESYQYKLNIIDQENLVQTIATPNEIKGFRTFTGALSFDKEKVAFNSILCKSERVAKVLVGEIKLVDGRLQCPTGFKITGVNRPQEGINSVGTINRAQQAYHFETGNFAKDIPSLGLAIPSTYFNFAIDILENGKLAQIKATPKSSNVNSYIGGILFTEKTGLYESITCASEQPTKDISESIKLVDDKLACPTGFKIHSPY